MKKLIFTAIAMIAFIGIANANTEKEKNSKLLISNVCDEIAYDTYNIWYGRGFSDEVARKKAKEAKDNCETLKKQS